MSATIWKFDLEITDEQVIEMPVGAKVLAVADQGQNHDTLQLWAEVRPGSRGTEPRRFFIAGTGHPLPAASTRRHIDTVISGPFVWHIFEGTAALALNSPGRRNG